MTALNGRSELQLLSKSCQKSVLSGKKDQHVTYMNVNIGSAQNCACTVSSKDSTTRLHNGFFRSARYIVKCETGRSFDKDDLGEAALGLQFDPSGWPRVSHVV